MSDTITITPSRFLAQRTAADAVTQAEDASLSASGFLMIANVTVEESHNDALTITQHPVQQGAAITDHAFKNPSQVTIRVGWTNSGAQAAGDQNYVAAIYKQLLEIQASRVPFSCQTGKRLYRNMLFLSLSVTTDDQTEAALMVVATLQEIIIVQTQVTTVPPAALHAAPARTAPTLNQGTVQPIPRAN